MKMTRMFALVAYGTLATSHALAQTTVDASPIAQWLDPIIMTVFGAVFLWGGRVLVSLAQRYVYSGIKSNALDNIATAAANEAGKIVAGSVDNLASKSIVVGGGNPFVTAAVSNIMTHWSEDVALLGLTPQRIEGYVIGKLGALQSNNPVVGATGASPVGLQNVAAASALKTPLK